MSDKMKFGDLFDKIAKEADSSPDVIRELKKQMGIALRAGLEKDGSVHLKGMGTFYRKWSDARDGTNPQTGEKIEIPAHNQISFRPDASVRRLINKENENLKIFLLDESGNKEPETPAVVTETETKIPGWMWILLAILALGLLMSLMAPPKEVTVIEETILIEEVAVTNNVAVVEEVIVIEELIVVEEVFITNNVPVAAAPVSSTSAEVSNASDIVEDIDHMPSADITLPADAGSSGAYIDPEIAEAEAGLAVGYAEDMVDLATEAKESNALFSEQKAEKAAEEAEQAIGDAMEAEERAEEAAAQ